MRRRFGVGVTLLAGAVPRAAAGDPVRATADGWGPLHVGMTHAEVVHALGGGTPGAVGGPEPARCEQFHPRHAPDGLIVMLEGRRLTRVTLSRRGIATDRGIEVGDPVSKVRAAYRGQALRDQPHSYVAAPARYLTWRRDRAHGIRYEIDAHGRVSSIHAGGPSIDYVEGCL